MQTVYSFFITPFPELVPELVEGVEGNRRFFADTLKGCELSFLIKPFPEFIERNKRFFAGTLQRGDMSLLIRYNGANCLCGAFVSIGENLTKFRVAS